jgi:Putative Actinobacterial Holin-X, holin superfamily III
MCRGWVDVEFPSGALFALQVKRSFTRSHCLMESSAMISSNGANQMSATRLVSAILSDFQDLVRQQFALLKAECRADWRKSKDAGMFLWISIVPLGCSAVLGTFAFAQLLYWLTLPSGVADPASLPLWACYAIVAVIQLAIGGVLFAVGWSKLHSVNPLHGESVQALEENIHWLSGRVATENRLEEPEPWTKRQRTPLDRES